MSIDIGSDAINRGNAFSVAGNTRITKDNAANAAGTITTVSIYAAIALTDVKVGTFYGSGTSWTNRSYASVGNVETGRKVTFTGLSITVEVGDLIGIYATAGNIDGDTTGYSGFLLASGDYFDGAEHVFASSDNYTQSLYGTDISPYSNTFSAIVIPDMAIGVSNANLSKVNGI